MGKATRLRRERADGMRRTRPLRVAFFDVDYERSSRAHGPGVTPAPPEGWVIGRSGLLHAEWDGTELRITGHELVGGRHPASDLIGALGAAQVVVGHGVLATDLRAAAMVTDVPDALLRRTVDLLALAHRLRGGTYPTGCNLSSLAQHNSPDVGSSKERFAASWPGLGGGPAPYRGDADPRDDAMIAARLWRAMLSARHVAWGGSTRCLSTREEGSAPLGEGDIEELTGRCPQVEAVQWRERLRMGRVLLPTTADLDVALLAGLGARDLPSPAQIRELVRLLGDAGAVPAGRQWSDEELYTACQYLGTKQNIDARQRIADGRRLTKPLRRALGWALWQIAHPHWSANYGHYSRLAYSRPAREGAAAAMLRMQTLNAEKGELWSKVVAIVA